MAKTPAPTTKADKSKYIKASGPFMQRIYQLAVGSAAVISAFAFTPTPSSADTRSPAVIQRGHYCLSYSQGGFDCSFTSYAQCEETASGQNAECYGNTAADDRDPWNMRAQQRPFWRMRIQRPSDKDAREGSWGLRHWPGGASRPHEG